MIDLDDPEREQFSVAVFYANDTHEYIVRMVEGRAAIRALHMVIDVAGEDRPDIVRVIVTDGGDNTNIEWKRGEGFTFPPELVGMVPVSVGKGKWP